MTKKKKIPPTIKITWQNVEQWMGSDASYSDYQEILADIANGVYDPKDVKSDIEGTCDL